MIRRMNKATLLQGGKTVAFIELRVEPLDSPSEGLQLLGCTGEPDLNGL